MGSKECPRWCVYSCLFFPIILGLYCKEVIAYNHEEDFNMRPNHLIVSGLTSFEPGRSLLEITKNGTKERDLGDTIRVDPLNKLKKYRGGFDIRNKHYWSSTIFTGIYGYAIAVVWLLVGLVYGVLLLAKTLCYPNTDKRKLPCISRQCSIWSLLLGTLLTILAITASGVVLGGSSRFHSKAKTVMNIIIDTADGASDTIYNVTGAMQNIQDTLGMTKDGAKAVGFLNTTSTRLDTEAAEISRQAKKNRKLIVKVLNIVYITTTIVVTMNLLAIIALFVSACLKFRRAIYTLIVLCWVLAIMCWVYFGLYFSVEKFLGDTCTALEDFRQDPQNNSLSSIVPCDELRSAKSVLFDTRVGIYSLINEVNANISALQSPSSRNLIQVCNPFTAPPDYHYQPENCPINTIRIGDIPQVIQLLNCSSGVGKTCKKGRFAVSDLKSVETYTSSIQKLLDAFPGMESLVECTLVKDAFNEILSHQCKPVKKYAKMVWSAMVFLSTTMVILILTWLRMASHDRKLHCSNGSVKPQSTRINIQEPEIPWSSTNHSEQNLNP